MNFDYSDEQKQLKAEARRYLEAHCTIERVHAVLDDGRLHHDPVLWNGLAEQGWLATALPEEFGGAGFGRIELCALAEELGRACAPTPFASNIYLFQEALMLAGSPEQQAKWLPDSAASRTIGVLAACEGPGLITAGSMKATVSDGRLSGTKIPVVDGEIATVAIVLARDGASSSLFLVELDVPGVARSPLKTLDPTRGAAELRFDDAPAERLGPSGEGWALYQSVMDRAAIYTAFEQIGGADRCLEMARAYAMSRYAFGRPIGVNQAIKHKLADMFVKNELARSHAYYGAWALSTDAPELPLAAAAARISACEAYWYACNENIQTHGGMGTTWESDCQLYFRRAQHLGLALGASSAWTEQLHAGVRAGSRATIEGARP